MSTTDLPEIKRVASGQPKQASLKRGKKLLSEKRFDDALAEFEGLVAQGEASGFVHTAIGRIKAKQGDSDAALQQFAVAARLDPSNAQPYLRSGRIHLQRKDLDKAELAFTDALRVNGKSAIGHAAMGLVSIGKGQAKQAVEHWKTALTYNPRLLPVRKRLASALHQLGRDDDAMAQINAAVRIDPKDAGSYLIKGRLHLHAKEYAGARDAFETAGELAPEQDSREVRLGLAEVYIASGDLDRAEQALGEIAPREISPAVHKLWGDLYKARGMHKEALEEYRSASLAADEDLGVEGLADLDLLAEDGDDDKWAGMAASAKQAAYRII
jgi:tetratricopeptide (TPR) repeat protein